MMGEVVIDCIPVGSRLGQERFGRKGARDDLAAFRNRFYRAPADHLHHEVAERRSFRWTRHDTFAGGVGSELVEQGILRASADDPHFV